MDYNETLLQAIDTVITARLSELQFDKTIVCTITDISERENGKYTVTDGTMTFDAFCDYTDYAEGAQVQVTIPNGDWSAQKTIIGRYSANTNIEPVVYVAPTEQVANLSGNIVDSFAEIGIAANGALEQKSVYSRGNLAINTEIHDTICVRAKFKTLFDNYSMQTGTYGIKLKITLESMKDTDKAEQYVVIDFSSAKDMFGRVYNFSDWTLQEQAYKFTSSIGRVKSVEAYLYQDGKFTYIDDNGKSPGFEPREEEGFNYNILIKDLEIFFGAGMATVEDNTVKIYTNSNLSYSPNETNKTIQLIWYNKGQGNKFLSFTDGEFDKDKATEASDQILDKNYYWIEWFADDASGVIQRLEAKHNTSLAFTCLPQLVTTNVYAVVWLNGKKYTSNTLTFSNQTDKTNLVLGKDITVSIVNDENAQDAYPIYMEDNQAILGEAYKTRKVKLAWQWNLGVLEQDYWNGAKVTWGVKDGPTLIQVDKREPQIISKDNFDEVITFTYRLKDTYDPISAQNSIITCTIEHKNLVLTTSKPLSFSSKGSSGTDYTLVIRPKDDRLFGFKDNNPAIATDFKGMLFDAAGAEITNIGVSISFLIGADRSHSSGTYNVLKGRTNSAVQWAGQSIYLETLYPIIYSYNDSYYAQAPTKIIYDSFGRLTTKIPQLKLFQGEEEISCTWSIDYWNGNHDPISAPPGAPKVENNKLQIPSVYLGDLGVYCVLLAQINGGETVYSCPLILQQYQYGSEILNEWDGAFSLDKQNNRIYSAAAVFGTKRENEFSGVILGKAQDIDNALDNAGKTGIYGYRDGVQSYGFRDDGTAFIGTSGTGRIYFDGDKGVIASAKYNDNANYNSGTKIDLQNGSLIMETTNGQYFKYNENNSGTLEMKISSANIQLDDQNTSLKNYITITNQSLISEFRQEAGYKCTAELYTDASDTGSVYWHITCPEGAKFTTGTVIQVQFLSANEQKKQMYFQMLIGENSSSWQKVYYGGALVTDTNPLTWTQSNTIMYFSYNDTTHTWHVIDGGAASKFTQTAQEIAAKVSNTYTGDNFSWRLTSKGFYLNNGEITDANENESIFICNSSGVQVKGKLTATEFAVEGDAITSMNTLISNNESVAQAASDASEAKTQVSNKLPSISEATGNFSWEFTTTSGVVMRKGGTSVFEINSTKGLWMNGNGEFTGKITAESGTIGALKIYGSDDGVKDGQLGLFGTVHEDGYGFAIDARPSQLKNPNAKIFGIGYFTDKTPTSGWGELNFYVQANGYMCCKSGSIAGWSVQADSFSAGENGFSVSLYPKRAISYAEPTSSSYEGPLVELKYSKRGEFGYQTWLTPIGIVYADERNQLLEYGYFLSWEMLIRHVYNF